MDLGLVSANAFARVDRAKEFTGRKLDEAPTLPRDADIALDSAGFVASVRYVGRAPHQAASSTLLRL
ncbi:MAG TPA: hypothetical protein PLF79_11855 [Thauera sp.]|nr:hypothetical protein [Thauera sp.]